MKTLKILAAGIVSLAVLAGCQKSEEEASQPAAPAVVPSTPAPEAAPAPSPAPETAPAPAPEAAPAPEPAK